MKTPLRVAVIGAGTRGGHLAAMLPELPYPTEIVAVCDPRHERCVAVAPNARHYASWELLFEDASCVWDAVIIATLDSQHTGPLLAAMARNVPVLIEKPITDRLCDAKKILAALETSTSRIAVCHTLRFLPAFRQLKAMIPAIGEVVAVQHEEAISNVRFAHNYVRGQWGDTRRNTHLFIHKCCHDVDFICSLLPAFTQFAVSSIGSRSYFSTKHAPALATPRCHDCPHNRTCRFSAVTLYDEADKTRWPASTVADSRTSLYGQCVFHCPNDVVDHQTAQILLDDTCTVTMLMTGFSGENSRRLRIQGVAGELFFDESTDTLTHWDFASASRTVTPLVKEAGYHPEDREIVGEWLANIFEPTHPPVTVDAREALRTLHLTIAVEAARLSGTTVNERA